MTTFEETSAQTIIEGFLQSSLPEYLLAGAASLLDAGGVMKIRLNKLPERWEIEGTVQGEDLEVYSSNLVLHMNERRADFLCNCMDCFSGACMHVGAVALKFLGSLNIDKDDAQDAPRSTGIARIAIRTMAEHGSRNILQNPASRGFSLPGNCQS